MASWRWTQPVWPANPSVVEEYERQGFRTDACMEVVVSGARSRCVVVLEDCTTFHKAPSKGSDTCATGVDVSETVDTAPCALGPVESWAVRWARHDAETRVGVAVA